MAYPCYQDWCGVQWVPRGCFTNVLLALQNNLAKIYKTRNDIYGENFKLKLCACAQSMALGTRTKFQLEILIRSTISAIHKFRDNILESWPKVSETAPRCYWQLGLLEDPGRKAGASGFNTLRPRQNGRHPADDIFKWIFLNENVWFLIKISLKFVPKGLINNIPSLVQIMAWRRPGNKPLCEPMMVILSTHICVTRPQWVNWLPHGVRWLVSQVGFPTVLILLYPPLQRSW